MSRMSTHEIAKLYRDAQAGDPVAGIMFDSLPAAEQRLGKQLIDIYSVKKSAKPKVKKAKKDPFQPLEMVSPIHGKIPAGLNPQAVSKAAKPSKNARRALLEADLKSADPMIREAARQALEAD